MDNYQVQDFCYLWVTEDRLGEERLRVARSLAFKEGIHLAVVRRVIAIELRDALLGPDPLGLAD